MKHSFYVGDAVEILRTLPDESVHCVVTSPPYWRLRDYGVGGQIGHEKTPDEYVERLVQVFREVKRVLRKDGTVWLNLGDSYAGDKTAGRNDTDKMYPGNPEALSAHKRLHIDHGLKPKDLVGIPWRVAFALQADGWWLRSDIIWCLSGGTYVYVRSQKGDMPMMVKDLARLRSNTVMLWNGQKWTRLKSMQPSNCSGEGIEIELRSGERISCTPEHWWPTTKGLKKAKDLRVGDILLSCQLPEPDSPATPEYVPDEIGWFVGLYLAEGSRDSNGTIQIASHVQEVQKRFERLMSIATKYGGTCRIHYHQGNAATICLTGKMLNAIIDTYIYGNTAQNKCLTTACWQRSNNFLQHLLLGYLEGDGHLEPENNRWRIAFTRNYNLERDLRTLCARLGYTLTLKLSESQFNGKKYKTFRGEIRIERSGHWNEKNRNEIMAIRKSRGRQFWDIEVEDEPHIFALASGVLTHNSKPNAMPESVKDRPTKSHEYIFLLTKSAKYFYDAEAVKEPANYDGSDVLYKGGKKYENINQRNARPHKRWQANESSDIVKNRRSVWWIPTKPFPGAHFATFPPDLVEICIKAGTSEYGCCPKCGAPWERVTEVVDIADYGGLRKRADAPGAEVSPTSVFRTGKVPIRKTVGWRPTCSCGIDEIVPCTVLDPFGGSGTTTLVAHQLGRNSIYIDLNPEYEQMARKRLLDAVGDSLVLTLDNVLYVQSNKQLKIALDE